MEEIQQTRPPDMYELLSTKLALPRPRRSLVAREPLLARLDAALEHKLTLLSAPAGFGKTTLVSEWCASRAARPDGLSAAWVSLDAGDNDPARFWRYMITACQVFDEAAGRSARDLLRSLQQLSFEAPQQFSLEPVLTVLLNGLAVVS